MIDSKLSSSGAYSIRLANEVRVEDDNAEGALRRQDSQQSEDNSEEGIESFHSCEAFDEFFSLHSSEYFYSVVPSSSFSSDGEDEDLFNEATSTEDHPSLFAKKSLKEAATHIQVSLQERISANEPTEKPAEFLRFIAKNTNPSKLAFIWENFVQALRDCIEKKSLTPLWENGFVLNCVNCSYAVEETLSQIYSTPKSPTDFRGLVQVNSGRPGSFDAITGAISSQVNSNEDNRQDRDYLSRLKSLIKPGQRALISVPVTGVGSRYSHAMNMIHIHTDGKSQFFIICGQSGTVFDLQKGDDVKTFYARHTNDASAASQAALLDHDIKYAIISDEQPAVDAKINLPFDASLTEMERHTPDPADISKYA
ncbi:hypothetical protein [Ottowia thiooxydans]|uniref:Uncharacterized protein n=1 Tax=Ottowia thiooxydans TaxID=219182 RepID=A0ABV2QI67_9BURK